MAGDSTPQAGSKKKRTTLFIVIGAAVIVLAGLLGAGLAIWKHGQATPSQVVNTSQNQAIGGDLGKAQADIDKALKRPGLSKDDKYMLYYQKGVNYQNHNQNQLALDVFKQAATFKQTQSLYTSMGDVAKALGDKQQAIAYYTKAIEYIPTKGNPVANEDKQVLQDMIANLQGANQ